MCAHENIHGGNYMSKYGILERPGGIWFHVPTLTKNLKRSLFSKAAMPSNIANNDPLSKRDSLVKEAQSNIYVDASSVGPQIMGGPLQGPPGGPKVNDDLETSTATAGKEW